MRFLLAAAAGEDCVVNVPAFDVFEVRRVGWYKGRGGVVKADSRFEMAKPPA